jgi:hypothetical protein
MVQFTTCRVLLSLGALRGVFSIPHLLTLHWSVLSASLGAIVGKMTKLSTLKESITNMYVGHTRSH